MLTKNQEKWVNHLRDDNHIFIKPFDTSAEAKFKKVKEKIQSVLGKEIRVVHRGATSMGISGQDEIDVYVPVPPDSFNELIKPLTKLFGTPHSNYPLERVRFVTKVGGKHIDIFLINEHSKGWTEGVKFETYLRQHPQTLATYRILKEEGNGLSSREYYRRKIEFYNEILAMIKS